MSPRDFTALRSDPFEDEVELSMYYFGLYHWRRRLRRLLLATSAGLGARLLVRRTTARWRRVVAIAIELVAAVVVARTGRKLLSPPPWVVRRAPYRALGTRLPFDEATAALDVGCGTGRSLVGLAPFVPADCAVVGLDVFDDRVILGNGPRLAERNGRLAGLEVLPIVGDAVRLPVASDTQDVVTACRVLHDLPAADQPTALAELHRVCAPDGTLGVLELPITPTTTVADPERYWRRQLTDAGFAVERLERVERGRGTEPYLVFVATPV